MLVAGGVDSANTPLASLEVYDPASGGFVTDGNALTAAPRFDHVAVALADGRVLLAGGTSPPLNQPTGTGYIYAFTALVGSPPTGVISTLSPIAAPMATARSGAAAVRLSDGKVLVTGGFVLAGGALQALQNGEVFDPQSGTFGAVTTTGGGLPNMGAQRGFHTITPLGDGTYVVVGGLSRIPGGSAQAPADIFADGSTGTVTGFLPTGVPPLLTVERSSHSAVALPSGDVLIAGGFTTGGDATSSAEVFRRATHTFEPLGVPVPMLARGDHAAVLVNAGEALDAGRAVLVTGGANARTAGAQVTSSAQLLVIRDGEACGLDADCGSGHCVAAVCCDTECVGTCRSCASGRCGPEPAGTSLGWTCANDVEVELGCAADGSPTVLRSTACPAGCASDRCAPAATDAAVDAVAPDAGAAASDGGGCGCRADAALGPRGWCALLLAGALIAARRRR